MSVLGSQVFGQALMDSCVICLKCFVKIIRLNNDKKITLTSINNVLGTTELHV